LETKDATEFAAAANDPHHCADSTDRRNTGSRGVLGSETPASRVRSIGLLAALNRNGRKAYHAHVKELKKIVG
jgi:hypothetical protein